MKEYLFKILLFSCLLSVLSCANNTLYPFWEIPDPDLKEIAMIRADPNWGTVVVYNPDTCNEIGDACMFFRRHAYAHEHLQHGLLAEPDDYPYSYEASADCWAATYSNSEENFATVNLLLDNHKNANLRIHGNLPERAERIRQCAIDAGKWTEAG